MINKLFIVLSIIIIIIIILIISFVIKKISDTFLLDLNKYENLRTEDIASIQDEELVYAVMSWMWSKFDSDWSNQYTVISSLPKACQDIYSVYTVEAEVNNGGFNQCYYNSSKQFANMAENGFMAIGAKGFSEIMIRANTTYADIKDDLEKFNDGTLEGFSKSYENNPLNELDDEFIKMHEREPLDKLCIEYIRANAQYFGD